MREVDNDSYRERERQTVCVFNRGVAANTIMKEFSMERRSNRMSDIGRNPADAKGEQGGEERKIRCRKGCD